METDKITNRQVRSRQRLLAGAIFAGLVMFAVGAVVVTEKPKTDRKPSETTLFSIRPEYADRETLIARYDAKILALSRDIAAIRSEAEEREKKLNATIILQEKALNTQSKSLAGIGTEHSVQVASRDRVGCKAPGVYAAGQRNTGRSRGTDQSTGRATVSISLQSEGTFWKRCPGAGLYGSPSGRYPFTVATGCSTAARLSGQ